MGTNTAVLPSSSARVVLSSVIFATSTLGVGLRSFTVTLHSACTPLPSFAVAVIIASPACFAVTWPLASTSATAGLSLAQVRSLSVASAGATVGTSVAVLPSSSARVVLSSVILVTSTLGVGLGSVTVTLHSACTPLPSFALAVIIASPACFAVTWPFSSTAATAGLSLAQVRPLSVASAGATVATNTAVLPSSSSRVGLSSVIFATSTFTSPSIVSSRVPLGSCSTL